MRTANTADQSDYRARCCILNFVLFVRSISHAVASLPEIVPYRVLRTRKGGLGVRRERERERERERLKCSCRKSTVFLCEIRLQNQCKRSRSWFRYFRKGMLRHRCVVPPAFSPCMGSVTEATAFIYVDRLRKFSSSAWRISGKTRAIFTYAQKCTK